MKPGSARTCRSCTTPTTCELLPRCSHPQPAESGKQTEVGSHPGAGRRVPRRGCQGFPSVHEPSPPGQTHASPVGWQDIFSQPAVREAVVRSLAQTSVDWQGQLHFTSGSSSSPHPLANRARPITAVIPFIPSLAPGTSNASWCCTAGQTNAPFKGPRCALMPRTIGHERCVDRKPTACGPAVVLTSMATTPRGSSVGCGAPHAPAPRFPLPASRSPLPAPLSPLPSRPTRWPTRAERAAAGSCENCGAFGAERPGFHHESGLATPVSCCRDVV
jgi:hypothetical protein